MKSKFASLGSSLFVLTLIFAMLILTACLDLGASNREESDDQKDETCEHTYGEWETVTEATCEAEGLERRVCSKDSTHTEERKIEKKAHVFGETLVSDATSHWLECECGEKKDVTAHSLSDGYLNDDYSHWVECECGAKFELDEHSFGDVGVVKTPATCTAAGVEVFTCTGCGFTEEREIAKLSHDFGEDFVGDANGHWQECECGAKTEVAAHSFDNGTVTTDPTCTAEGVKTFTCADCGETKTESVNKLAHDFEGVDWSSDESAHYKKCKNCTATTANGDHEYDDGVVTTDPTCTENGVKTFTCEICSATKTEPVNKIDHEYEQKSDGEEHWFECTECGDTTTHSSHVWDDGEVTTEPTCTENGVKTFTCECSATKTETIGKLDHDFEGVQWSSNESAHYKKCKNCTATTANADHEYDDGVVTDDPTCTENGVKTFTCEICSATKTETVNKLDHDFDVEWSFDADGHWKKCSRCEETTAEADHEGSGADCSHKAVCSTCEQEYGDFAADVHKGGVATCTDKAVCEDCDTPYGTTNAANHTNDGEFDYAVNSTDPEKHDKIYVCCGHSVLEDHTGGSATCTDKAVCELCRSEYGEIVPTNHIIKKINKVEPECESAGCEEYWLCQECGTTYADDNGNTVVDVATLVIEELGHDHKEVSRKAATCTEDGLVTSLCSRCDDEVTETLTAPGHDMKHSDEDSLAPSCEAVGYNYNKCTVCGETEFVEELAKTPCTETVATTESTCSEAGEKVYTCSECGKSRKETLPLADHVYTDTPVAVTCLTDGYTLHECVNCDYSYTSDPITKLGHDYEVDSESSTVLTCLTDGVTVEVCKNCDDKKITTVEAEGHKFSAATCTAPEICSACSATGNAAHGHSYPVDPTETVPATCTENGKVVYSCSYGCGETKTEIPDEYKAKGHNETDAKWTESVVAVENKLCTFKTLRTAECPDCHETVNSYGDEYVNHTYVGTLLVAANCQRGGTMAYKCSACGEDGETDNDYKPTVEEGQTLDLHNWAAVRTTLDAESGVDYTHYCTVEGCDATKTVVDASAGVSAEQIKGADKVQAGEAEIAFDDDAKNNLDGNISISAGKLTINELAEKNASLLEGIDQEVLDKITSNTNGILSLEATKNGEAFGDEGSGGFNGTVTVKIPYELQEGDDPNEIVVWYFGSEGLVAMKAVYTEFEDEEGNKQGYATFETGHFSYYTVTRMSPAERCGLYGHNWDGEDGQGKTYIATCLEKGYTIRTCLRCKTQEVSNPVDALGHNFRVSAQEEATCTLDGTVTHACERCSVTYTVEVKAIGHNYVIADSKAASCTEAGYETLECSACGDSHTTNIARLAHVYEESESVLATCTTDGYIEHVCVNCSFKAITDYVAAQGHVMESEDIPATCTTKGHTKNWCVNCDEKFANTNITELSDVHEWNVDEPTCEIDKVCVNCNKLADGGKAVGHLVDDGYCQKCGEDFSKNCDHENLGEGSTLELKKHVPSSCHSHGYDQYVCKTCKKKIKINNPELDEHKYELVKSSEATCTAPAYDLEVCKHCGVQNREETSPALGHSFVGSSCERCGLSTDNFYLNMLETWANVDGFAITAKDLNFYIYNPEKADDGSEIWKLIGSIAQIDVAELMLYVDSDGKLHGAAHGEIKVFNGPINNEWATLGMKAVIEDGMLYVYAYGTDSEGSLIEEVSVSFELDGFVRIFLEDNLDLDYEDLELLLGWVSDFLVPVLTSYRDANAEEIDEILGKLVNLVFTARVEGDGFVYYLDYSKIRQINDDLRDLTVSQVVDKYFGEGSYATLTEFVFEVLGLKLSELPEFAESIGLNVNELSEAINSFCYVLLGAPEEFDIMDVIAEEAYGSYTVDEIISMIISSGNNNGDHDNGEMGDNQNKPGYTEPDGDYGEIGGESGGAVVYPPVSGGGTVIAPVVPFDPEKPGYVIDPNLNGNISYVPVVDKDVIYDDSTDGKYDDSDEGGYDKPEVDIPTEDIPEDEEVKIIFSEQLKAMLDQIGAMKLYEAMAGEEGASQIHSAVDSVISMLENVISIEITTDQSGNITDYEISIDELEFSPSEYSKVEISITVNILPDARLNFDFSDIIEKIKAETKIPELEDMTDSDQEYNGSYKEEKYEFGGKYYYAEIAEVRMYYYTFGLSKPLGVVSMVSCGEWREIEATFPIIEEYVIIRMVNLYDKETEENIRLFVNARTDEYIQVVELEDSIKLIYSDGTEKVFSAEAEPDYTDVFPASWWNKGDFDYEGEHFYYNPVTGEISEKDPHTYVLDEENSKAPVNCGTDGYNHFVCSVCGDSYDVYYNEFQHNYVLNEEKSEIAGNCNQMSSYYFECTECGAYHVERYSKGHGYAYRYEFVGEEKNCENGVYVYRYCPDCGYNFDGDYEYRTYHVTDYTVDFDGENVSYLSECEACGYSNDNRERVHFTVDTDLELTLSDRQKSDYWYTEFKFTPTESGIYEFYSFDRKHEDPRATISDENGRIYYENDDYWYETDFGKYDSWNFAIAAELEAGKTYYLGVRSHEGMYENSFKVAFRMSTTEEIDLAEYGCECGGKMIITSEFIFKNVGFELNCDMSESESCSECGFYYRAEGGTQSDENCTEYTYYSIFFGNESAESEIEYPIFKSYTGNVYHETYHEWIDEPIYDEEGNIVGHRSGNKNVCNKCENVTSMYLNESYFDEHGNTVYSKNENYSWSTGLSALAISSLTETRNERFEVNGEAVYKVVYSKQTNYFDGVESGWMISEYSYDVNEICKCTVTVTSSYDKNYTEQRYSHESYQNTERFTSEGTLNGETVTVRTEKSYSVCRFCGQITSDYYEREEYFSIEGYQLGYENRWYDFGSETPREVEREEYGIYKYANGECDFYTVLRVNYNYDEKGNLVHCDGWKHVYSDSCNYDEYRLFFDEEKGGIVEIYSYSDTNHRDWGSYYVLHDGSVSCTDGVDEVYGCRACGYEEQRKELVGYEHDFTSSYECVGTDVYRKISCSRCGEAEGDGERYFGIVSDETLGYVRYDYEGVYLSFVPTVSGRYLIYSFGNYSEDPYVWIFNSANELIAYNDNSAEGNNFGISPMFNAGETYYIKVRSMRGADLKVEYATVRLLDLSEYGCKCGGNLEVYKYFDGESIRVTSTGSYDCRFEYVYDEKYGRDYTYCTECGFAYFNYYTSDYEGCEQINKIVYYLGNTEMALEEFTELVLYSYKTGNTNHSYNYSYDEKTEEGVDENGNPIRIVTNTEQATCSVCGKKVSEYVNIYHYDKDGNEIYRRCEENIYSSEISDTYLVRVREYKYVMLSDASGNLGRYRTLYYEEYYNVRGELVRWEKTERVYGPTICDVTITETDSNNSYNQYVEKNHSTTHKELPDESGWNEEKNVYTNAYEYYCSSCGASIEKYVTVTTYDANGNVIKAVTTHYVLYAKSETDYGYRHDYVTTEIYGVYEYQTGKFATYVISRVTESYNENGEITSTSSMLREYNNGNYCEFVEVYYENGEETNRYDNTEHLALRYECRLREGAESCLDGVERWRVCDCCDYETIYSSNWSNSHLKDENAFETIDMSAYSDCGGYLTVYSCPCGDRKYVETSNLGCYGALGQKTDYYNNGWLETEDGWRYYNAKYTLGCSVTHDAEGENICGFKYTYEYWRTADENCREIYHYVYTFYSADGKSFTISYDYETGDELHRTVTESENSRYTEDGYYVNENRRTDKCANCSELSYVYVDKYYYATETDADESKNPVKRAYEHSYYSNGIIYDRYGYEYLYLVDRYGGIGDYQTYWFDEDYSNGVMDSFEERISEYDTLYYDGTRYGVVNIKEIYRSGSNRDNITYVEISLNEYEYMDFDGKVMDFYNVKSVYSSGKSENDITDTRTETYEYDIVYSVDKDEWLIEKVKERREYGDGRWEEVVWDYSKCIHAYTQITTYSDGRTDEYTNEHYWYSYYTEFFGYKTHPTCTEDGVAYRRCSWCHEVTEEVRSAFGHDYVYTDNNEYACYNCGLVNFTSYDGAVSYEDFTARLGNGTHFVVRFRFNYDSIDEYTLYVSAVKDGELVDFLAVEPRIEGNFIYLAAEDVIAALAMLETETVYDICDIQLSFAFVPNTDSSNFDCAITLDAHLPVYKSVTSLDENGSLVHSHSLSCALCEKELEDRDLAMRNCSYNYRYDNSYGMSAYYYDYFCGLCGEMFTIHDEIENTQCGIAKVRTAYRVDENGALTVLGSLTVEAGVNHSYESSLSEDDKGNVVFSSKCSYCGYASKDVISVTVDSEYDLDYSYKNDENIIILYAFTPTESGIYKFYSSDHSDDTYGCIYDSEMNELASDDDGAGDHDFMIQYELEAGKTYYLGSRFWGVYSNGYYTVHLVKAS